MEESIIKYLYQPSPIIEVSILLALIISFTKPQYLIALATSLLLLRPNERFECFISYPKVIYPILALSLILFSDKENWMKQIKSNQSILYFIVFIIVQTILFHFNDTAKNIEFIIVGLLLFFASVVFSADPKSARFLSYAVVISSLFICGEAVYYHYTEEVGSLVWKYFHTPGNPEVGRLQAWGNWGNANETAFLACIGIANLVFLCVRFRSKVFYVMSAGLIPFFLLVVFLTASRAGLATMALIALPMVFLLNSKATKTLVLITLTLALILSSAYSPERLDREASSEDRFDLRYGGVQLVKQYPLIGVGFHNAVNESGGMELHNTYLQALAETGLIGASFLFYYIFSLGRRIYRLIIYNTQNNLSNSNASVVAGLFLSCNFYFLWGNQLLSVLFFLCMAEISTQFRLVENDIPQATKI